MRDFRCAFLTQDKGVFAGKDDPLLASSLEERGWKVTAEDWKDETVRWESFDLVLVRSPWDYYLYPSQFMDRLQHIEASCRTLVHDLQTIRWNMDKVYLTHFDAYRDLVIPTRVIDMLPGSWSALDFRPFAEAFGSTDLIVKPTISAGSHQTFRLDSRRQETMEIDLPHDSSPIPYMVQPFVPTVCEEGEYSLVFLGGEYHHAMLKRPKRGDFRVQSQHGGNYERCEPDPWLIDLSRAMLSSYAASSMYARLDWVRNPHDRLDAPFWLMEMELIEPDLYLRFTQSGIETYSQLLLKKYG